MTERGYPTPEGIEAMAASARPIDDADWGSERQVEAQNLFGLAMEEVLSAAAFAALEDYWLKATDDEAIDYALVLYAAR